MLLTAGPRFARDTQAVASRSRAMFLMACQKSGLSAKNFMRLMGMKSYKTAWTLAAQAAPRDGSAGATKAGGQG